MKKIQLISPPAYGLKDKLAYPPLGLLYLASNLEKFHDIRIKNMLSDKEFLENGFDIFGVSIHSSASYSPAREIIRRIRADNKYALIAVGGAFPTSMAEYTLNNTEADVVVVGEGERVFSNLCKEQDLSKVKGIFYKKGTEIIRNELEPLIDDLDTIKFPARHLLPKEMIKHEGKVHHSNQPATTIFGTRGCLFNCGFCDTELWRRKWRSRSPENMVEEIELIKKEYGIRQFRFPDDCLNLNRKWFFDFCDKITSCGINWTMLSRSDVLYPEMLKKMKTAGCREIFFGFETGSQKLLDLMQKKISVNDNIRAIKMCQQAGILSCAYMMFGFPGEDEETIKDTKHFLLKAKPDKSRLSQFIPVPGSDVWKYPQKYRIRIKENFNEHWYFDSPDFAVEYDYIGNKKMEELREDLNKFFKSQGYFSGWEEAR